MCYYEYTELWKQALNKYCHINITDKMDIYLYMCVCVYNISYKRKQLFFLKLVIKISVFDSLELLFLLFSLIVFIQCFTPHLLLLLARVFKMAFFY